MSTTMPDLPPLVEDLPEGYTHTREFHSYSSIDLYAQCPAAYKFRYIDKHIDPAYQKPTVGPNSPLELGTLLHRCLELSTQALVAKGHHGSVIKQAALYYDNLNAAFAEQPGCGAETLIDAQEILKPWLQSETVFAEHIRGLEWPFELVLEDAGGDIQIRGYIDRLEISPDGSVTIIDYKSSRLLFTKDELRRSLQASIYELAVRDSPALGIDAEVPVTAEFVMLRHPGVRQRTHRSLEQLHLAFTTVVGLVRKIEGARTFKPQLNKYCGYCDARYRCPLWRSLVENSMPVTAVNPMDLQAIAEEYERLNNAAKVLYARKEEMGDLIRIHLIGHETVESSQHVYRMSSSRDTEFLDPHRVAWLLAKAFNKPLNQVMGRLTSIKKTEYDFLMKALGGKLGIQEMRQLQDEMATLMEVTPNPKLQAYKAQLPTGKPAVKIKRQRAVPARSR